MCESKVYLKENAEEKLVITDVVLLMPMKNGYVFTDISGKKHVIEHVVIDYIDFIGHKIVLKKQV
ncbi:MAG: CooT family nickel-binding protein [Desulfurococcaceae archaeon]